MRRSLAAIVLPVLGAACHGAPLARPEPVSAESGNAVRGHVIFVDAPDDPEPISEIGAPALVSYLVENRGRADVTVWHATFFQNHRAVVLDAKGSAPPLSPIGRELSASFAPRGPRDKNFPWIIKAGSTDDGESDPFDVARLFDLSAPGRYTLRIDYEEDIAFSSNTLPFWRVRPGVRALLRELEAWPAGAVDAFERRGGKAVGDDTRAFVASRKATLRERGVEVRWDAAAGRYRVVSAR